MVKPETGGRVGSQINQNMHKTEGEQVLQQVSRHTVVSEHHTSETDPHAWLDLAMGLSILIITEVLKSKDPKHEDYYQNAQMSM